jgi:hypothetical protein
MPAKSEVQDYVRLLRHAIRAAGLTVTEVERRLGDGAKSLRRVFTGEVDLRFRHVISVLEVIGLSQEDFFAMAARDRRSRQQPSPGVDQRGGVAGADRPPPQAWWPTGYGWASLGGAMAPAHPMSEPPADHPEPPAAEHFSADLCRRFVEKRASRAEKRKIVGHLLTGCGQCAAYVDRIAAEYRDRLG